MPNQADMSALSGTVAVVTGGAGFLGSHLCERLLDEGAQVVAIDNLVTGREDNIAHLFGRPGFRFVNYDVTDFLHVPGEVDYILHFASPASPVDYMKLPIQTLKVGALGTHKALGLARAKGARFMLASTSEVYGDPQVNPQPESYWGHVNPIGPRGMYDEAKRFAEAMTMAYHRAHDVDVRIARIFNSILGDEQVLYDDGRQLHRETVGQLAERLGGRVGLSGFSVPAFDGTGSMVSASATALVGHPPTGPCFEVRTRYGRSIRVTGDHSLFVEGEQGLPVPKPVSDLEVGDRVAIAARIQVQERDRRAVSLVEAWMDAGRDPWNLQLRGGGIGDLVHRLRRQLIDVYSRGQRGKARQSAWSRITTDRRREQLPLAAFQRFGQEIPPWARARLRTSGRSAEMPAWVEVTDELLWFFGLFVAEGCTYESLPKSAYIIVSGEEQLLDRASKVMERELNLHAVRVGPSKDRAAQMLVHSQLLLLLLDHLGFGRKTKRIPGWVLGLPLERLRWFLEGYREGDGVHSGMKYEEGTRHEFSTTSEALKDDLIVALGRFGLLPSVGYYETTFKKKTGDRKYPFWRLTACNVSPWSPLDWDQGVTQVLNARRTGDLVWASVTSIEDVEPSELVYDFCVPGYENFWAGSGVMAHNTYGPRLRPDDGRAVPTFIGQALAGQPLTVHGDGSQTRSLCYVEDEVEGLVRLLVSDYVGPVNIGNPHEVTVNEIAETIVAIAGSASEIVHVERPQDDPEVRCPDTTVAERELGWKAQIPLEEGLRRTITWFREALRP